MNHPYRVVIIGAGNIANQHLRAIRVFGPLKAVAVADLNGERARALAEAYGTRHYLDYKQMIDEERPDIAVVTLPHFLHKEAALFCASRGVHLLLEKPMGLDAEECDEIITAVRQAGITVLVGHTQQYIAENLKAKEIIHGGSLGRLVMINDTRHVYYYKEQRPAWFFEKLKAGGGIMTNLGSHSVDKIQWLTGSRIAKVRAVLSHYGEKGDVEGSGLVFAETAEGVPATIAQSGYRGVNDDVTEFIFTNGALRLKTGISLEISCDGEYRQVPIERRVEPFVLQFEDLLDALQNGKEPSCTLEYSRSVVAVLDAIYQSHEQKAEVHL